MNAFAHLVSTVVNSNEVVADNAIVKNDQVAEAIQEKKLSKADKARAVFADCYKDVNNVPARKDIINRMMKEADLTKDGAATYLQNFKKKNGFVKAKAA